MKTEALQEPYQYCRHEDDGESPLQEVACLLPKQQHGGTQGRHTIVGQFHDERHCLSPESGMLEEERDDDTAYDTEDV